MWKEFVLDWATAQIRYKASAENPTFVVIQPEEEWLDLEGFKSGVITATVPGCSDYLTLIIETAKLKEGPWYTVVTRKSLDGTDNNNGGGFFLTNAPDARPGNSFFRYIRWRIEATPPDTTNVYGLGACFRVVAMFRT